MSEIKNDITESFGTLSGSTMGWMKELNRISWNGGAPKFDIRDLAPEHEKTGTGVTLFRAEAEATYNLLGKALGRNE